MIFKDLFQAIIIARVEKSTYRPVWQLGESFICRCKYGVTNGSIFGEKRPDVGFLQDL